MLAARRASPTATHPAAPHLSQAVSSALLLVQLVPHVMALRTESWAGPTGPAALRLSRRVPLLLTRWIPDPGSHPGSRGGFSLIHIQRWQH